MRKYMFSFMQAANDNTTYMGMDQNLEPGSPCCKRPPVGRSTKVLLVSTPEPVFGMFRRLSFEDGKGGCQQGGLTTKTEEMGQEP